MFDEADFRFSDQTSDVIKILNNGSAKGFPVLRSVSQNGHSFTPQAFNVFGPKVIATRQVFQDNALESRCITELSSPKRVRTDIPVTLPEDFDAQALSLRNKLLRYRFDHFYRLRKRQIQIDSTLDPRIQQIMQPMLRVAESDRSSQIIADHATKMSQELSQDRGWQIEAEILRVIRDLWSNPASTLSVSAITTEFAKRANEGFEIRINNRWMGHQLRKVLGLSTHKSRGVFVLSPQNAAKLELLYKKFDLDPS